MEDLPLAYGIDLGRAVFIGNSNGGNFLGAVMQLHPQVVRRAVLLRPMNVLEARPEVDLSATSILTVSGARDPYAPQAKELEERFASAGAAVTVRQIDAGHALDAQDAAVVGPWLADTVYTRI